MSGGLTHPGSPGPLRAEWCVWPFLIGRKDTLSLRDWVVPDCLFLGGRGFRKVAQRQDRFGNTQPVFTLELPNYPLPQSPSPPLSGEA